MLSSEYSCQAGWLLCLLMTWLIAVPGHHQVWQYKKGLNTLRPRQMAANFLMTFSNAFFLNRNISISIKISLKFVPNGLITIFQQSLIKIMAWRRPGDTPLYEPMVINLRMHICIYVCKAWISYYIPQQSLSCDSLSICSWKMLDAHKSSCILDKLIHFRYVQTFSSCH